MASFDGNDPVPCRAGPATLQCLLRKSSGSPTSHARCRDIRERLCQKRHNRPWDPTAERLPRRREIGRFASLVQVQCNRRNFVPWRQPARDRRYPLMWACRWRGARTMRVRSGGLACHRAWAGWRGLAPHSLRLRRGADCRCQPDRDRENIRQRQGS